MKYIVLKNGDKILYDENVLPTEEAIKYQSQPSIETGIFPLGFLYDDTYILQKEMHQKIFRTDRSIDFENGMKSDASIKIITNKEKIKKPSKIYHSTNAIIKNEDVPKSYIAMGGKIIRKIEVVDVEFDKNGKLNMFDDKGKKVPKLLGTHGSSTGNIEIYTRIGRFNIEDNEKILKVEAEYKNLVKKNEPNYIDELFNKFGDREVEMFFEYYKNFSNSVEAHQKVRETFFHEAHHSQSNALIKARNLNPEAKPVGLENNLRLQEDDEKAAEMKAMFMRIESYFKNDEDISFLEHNDANSVLNHVKTIKRNAINSGKSDADIKADIKTYLLDYKNIAKTVAKDWDQNKSFLYKKKGQPFDVSIREEVELDPTSMFGDDNSVDNPEYLQRRKHYYQFMIYNPDTKKHEPHIFADDIDHAIISKEMKKDIIEPCKKILDKRRKNIKPEVLAIAKELNDQQWTSSKQHHPEVFNINDETQPVEKKSEDTSYKNELREYYQKVCEENKYIYKEDKNSEVYSAKLIKEKTITTIEANAINNINLGAKTKSGKAIIPDYKDFVDIVNFAKSKNQPISFGNIRSPEYKARLYIACLEAGVKINNPPKAKELQGISPEIKTKILRHAVKNKQTMSKDKMIESREHIDNFRQVIRDGKKNDKTDSDEYKHAKKIIELRKKVFGGRS